MAIHFQKHQASIVECDFCSFTDDIDGPEFTDIVEEMKIRNWKIGKDKNDEWTHKCPSCVDDDNTDDMDDHL